MLTLISQIEISKKLLLIYFNDIIVTMFYFDDIDNKKVLKSDLIKNAQAFFTTKEICICDKSEVENEIVIKNRKIITEFLDINDKNFISPVQTHSANIKVVNPDVKIYPDTDALILTEHDCAIYLNFADCTPVIFYDEVQNIGAIAHAGWRGTAKNIVKITALKLINEFHSKTENLKVIIGPAICSDCFEVGENVIDQLKHTVDDFEGLYFVKNDKLYVDLKEINKKQLTSLGIKNIDICPYCTCCDNEYFYSYRKENGTTLRHSAVLKLF